MTTKALIVILSVYEDSKKSLILNQAITIDKDQIDNPGNLYDFVEEISLYEEVAFAFHVQEKEEQEILYEYPFDNVPAIVEALKKDRILYPIGLLNHILDFAIEQASSFHPEYHVDFQYPGTNKDLPTNTIYQGIKSLPNWIIEKSLENVKKYKKYFL